MNDYDRYGANMFMVVDPSPKALSRPLPAPALRPAPRSGWAIAAAVGKAFVQDVAKGLAAIVVFAAATAVLAGIVLVAAAALLNLPSSLHALARMLGG